MMKSMSLVGGTKGSSLKDWTLGVAMKTVAAQLGGYGGGHKIAAGATIALGKEQEFLEKVNSLLMQQMKG